MSAAAREARRKNFSMPSVTEIQEMQTLEREREQRIAQRHQREQQRAQGEMQNASIFSQVIIQVPSLIEINGPLIKNCREYLEIYSANALAQIKKDPDAREADPEPPDDESEPGGDAN